MHLFVAHPFQPWGGTHHPEVETGRLSVPPVVARGSPVVALWPAEPGQGCGASRAATQPIASPTPPTMASSRVQQRLARLAAQLQPAPAAVVQQPPTPQPGVNHPRRFAATDPVEEQAAFFTTHGYCFVEGALAGEELKAAQDAYERHAPPTREAWQRAHEAGTRQADVGTYGNTNALMKVDLGPGYGEVDVKNLPDHSWDIPRVAELDDAFVKLAEVPSLMPLLFKVMGPDLELMQINLRTSPGGQQPGQNRGWHRQVPRLLSHCPLAFVHARAVARRDMESMQDGWSHPTLSSRVKIFTYLYDVAPNGGMTGIVPDSFRRPDNPQTAGLDPTKDPPGAMVIGAKAGSAMVFDIHSWHAGTPNESDAPRTPPRSSACVLSVLRRKS